MNRMDRMGIARIVGKHCRSEFQPRLSRPNSDSDIDPDRDRD
jgi:hypothetical protein